MGQIKAQTHPAKLSHACADREQPTFFFGELARSQLVDPIVGDEHFENEASIIENLLADPAQKLKVQDKCTSSLPGSGNTGAP